MFWLQGTMHNDCRCSLCACEQCSVSLLHSWLFAVGTEYMKTFLSIVLDKAKFRSLLDLFCTIKCSPSRHIRAIQTHSPHMHPSVCIRCILALEFSSRLECDPTGPSRRFLKTKSRQVSNVITTFQGKHHLEQDNMSHFSLWQDVLTVWPINFRWS